MSSPYPRRAIATRRLPPRAVSIWLALAVALLSSLMSSGLPRTTSFGSAFNPATTAVALQPTRAQPRILVEQVRRDDDPVGGQSEQLLPLSTIVPPVAYTAAAATPKPAAAARLISPRPGLVGNPRGPPIT